MYSVRILVNFSKIRESKIENRELRYVNFRFSTFEKKCQRREYLQARVNLLCTEIFRINCVLKKKCSFAQANRQFAKPNHIVELPATV
jgi:hypothetical protein